MITKRQREERTEKEAFWRPHIRAWQSTDMTVRAYCKANNLKHHQFKYWKYKLVSTAKPASCSSPPANADFVELKSSAPPALPRNLCYDIKTELGFDVSISGSVNTETLKMIFATIKELS